MSENEDNPFDHESESENASQNNENQSENESSSPKQGVRKADWMEIDNLNEIPPRLGCWNMVAAVFQFAQSAVLFYLASDADTEWYLYTNYANLDERGDGGAEDEFGRPDPDEVASYSVTWYSAVFILLSGLDHLIVSLPYFKSKYEYYIQRSQNPFRWTEYALSASLMRVMIAQLSGVTDAHLLACIFVLAAITMILGAIHESVNAKARADGYKQNWFPFLAAWVPHICTWVIIFMYFFTAVSEGDPPAFVWSIVFILFILDGTFALLFWFQWSKTCGFQDYVRGEFGFILLSFTAKTLLAWINYGGGSR